MIYRNSEKVKSLLHVLTSHVKSLTVTSKPWRCTTGTGNYISIKSVVWNVRIRAFCRERFICVFGCGGLKRRLWVMPWTGPSFAWGEIPEQAAMCWQMQPQRGEHVHRRLLTEALHSSSTLQGSRQADGAHLSEVLNADSRNAFLNRLPVLMKLANAWPDLPRTAKNCQMHESFFCSSYPSLKKQRIPN